MKTKHKPTLLKSAAEEPTAEAENLAPSEAVMEFVREHADQVERSDKEIPESLRDFHPMEGDIDPGGFFLPKDLSYSRLQSSSVEIANVRGFMRQYGEMDGVYLVGGSHGTAAVAIRISAITQDILDTLMGLIEDYPAMDDMDVSQVEHERIDEAWTDWAHFDFIRALEQAMPEAEELIDGLDDDRARELFDNVRDRINVEWSEDSSSMYIDIEKVAAAVTEEDLKKS